MFFVTVLLALLFAAIVARRAFQRLKARYLARQEKARNEVVEALALLTDTYDLHSSALVELIFLPSERMGAWCLVEAWARGDRLDDMAAHHRLALKNAVYVGWVLKQAYGERARAVFYGENGPPNYHEMLKNLDYAAIAALLCEIVAAHLEAVA